MRKRTPVEEKEKSKRNILERRAQNSSYNEVTRLKTSVKDDTSFSKKEISAPVCPPVYRGRLLVVEESRAECHCLSPSSPVQSVVPFPSPVLVLVLSLHVILHKSLKYLVVLYSLISTDDRHCLPPSQQRSVVTCPCPCALSSCVSSEESQILCVIAIHQLIT